jgi:hypothetical protein
MDDSQRRIMSDEVFEKALFWLDILCRRGTQQEVNLNGNGESTLDPQLPMRVRRVKDIAGARPVAISSNGIGLTKELVSSLKDNGLDRLDLSPHNAYAARQAAVLLSEVGMPGILNTGSILTSHNWAGQLPEEHQINMLYTMPCHPLIEGRGYILVNGDLTPCCYDFKGLGVFGHVKDIDLLYKPIKAYSLCQTCHQVIPGEIREAA